MLFVALGEVAGRSVQAEDIRLEAATRNGAKSRFWASSSSSSSCHEEIQEVKDQIEDCKRQSGGQA